MNSTLARRFGNGIMDLVDDFWTDSLYSPSTLQAKSFPVDVYEQDGNWTVEASLPGVKKEDIYLDVDGNILEIKVEKKNEKREEGARYALREVSYGASSRSFSLPRGVDKENPVAELRDGILKIKFNKTDRGKIDIQVT